MIITNAMILKQIAYQSGFDAHTFRCLEGQCEISSLKANKRHKIKARVTKVIEICFEVILSVLALS